jgi:hypothetical protein
MAYDRAELRAGVFELFAEAQRKGTRPLRLVAPDGAHVVKRVGREPARPNADRDRVRRWRASNPGAYAAHREAHNAQRRGLRTADPAEYARRLERRAASRRCKRAAERAARRVA